jgi:hypothetical protein
MERLVFDSYAMDLQLCFNCASIVLQLFFNCASIVLQLCFNCASVVQNSYMFVLKLLYGCMVKWLNCHIAKLLSFKGTLKVNHLTIAV